MFGGSCLTPLCAKIIQKKIYITLVFSNQNKGQIAPGNLLNSTSNKTSAVPEQDHKEFPVPLGFQHCHIILKPNSKSFRSWLAIFFAEDTASGQPNTQNNNGLHW